MTAMQLTDETFATLNSLYLRKMADLTMIADCSGLDPVVAGAAMRELTESALVIDLGGQFVVTDDGRRAVLDYYDRVYADLRALPAVVEWYETFENNRNGRFLELVSSWQQSDGDERIVDRILKLVERHIRALDEATAWMTRYAVYATRFRKGLDRIESGQMDWLTSPLVDSVHNTWFEFHEDILAVLGRPRETVEG